MGKLELHAVLPPFVKLNAEQCRAAVDPLPAEARWSAEFDPPAIGADIRLKINSIGRAKVVGYATLDGWLGVMTVPYDPPIWWVVQNGQPCDDKPALAFGVEIGLLP